MAADVPRMGANHPLNLQRFDLPEQAASDLMR